MHNGKKALSPDVKIDLDTDTLELDGKPLLIQKHLYLMLNKPSGVLSAARDPKQPTVLDLVPETYRRSGLFPAGRLDKDTEGFVLITDDGEFAHSILSPKHHVPKTYHARIDGPLTEQMVEEFAIGVVLEDGVTCNPAQLSVLENGEQPLCQVILTQGMYHQVKRMFLAFGRRVLWLKRTAIGGLLLDNSIAARRIARNFRQRNQNAFWVKYRLFFNRSGNLFWKLGILDKVERLTLGI